jgi:hypothetical protein
LLRDGFTITKKARGTAKDLLRQWDSLWTYVDMENSDPTNNAAESAIQADLDGRPVPEFQA